MDLDAVRLRPISDAEFDRFFERSHLEYAEEISRNGKVSMDAALAKATADFARLLPDGHQSPDHHVYVIVDGSGAIIGELWIGLSQKPDGIEAFGYDFWVEPALRGAGIGRKAMQLGAERARKLGATRLALNVFGDNDRARHLYESFGFQVVSTNMAMDLTVS